MAGDARHRPIYGRAHFGVPESVRHRPRCHPPLLLWPHLLLRRVPEWFKNDDSSLVPVENKFAIFWNSSHAEAVIAVFTKYTDGMWLSSDGMSYDNCCRFVSMAQYRMILNVPDDMNIPLPLGFLDEIRTKETETPPKMKSKSYSVATGSETVITSRPEGMTQEEYRACGARPTGNSNPDCATERSSTWPPSCSPRTAST